MIVGIVEPPPFDRGTDVVAFELQYTTGGDIRVADGIENFQQFRYKAARFRVDLLGISVFSFNDEVEKITSPSLPFKTTYYT